MTSNLNDDYEPGEDVTEEFESPPQPAGIVVSARLAPEDSAKLIDLAEQTDRTVSQIARLAIRGFLAAAETKSEELPEMTFAADPEGRGFVVRAIASSPATEGARAHTEEVPSDS